MQPPSGSWGRGASTAQRGAMLGNGLWTSHVQCVACVRWMAYGSRSWRRRQRRARAGRWRSRAWRRRWLVAWVLQTLLIVRAVCGVPALSSNLGTGNKTQAANENGGHGVGRGGALQASVAFRLFKLVRVLCRDHEHVPAKDFKINQMP